ncbi:uncharacterized protein LOC135950889 [Calliphora vicina]|uniref:uncharacterized protein LOC135950889 n=1 Tax=Calliphora vicina TaxID=7373 RepID=UPI00325AEBD3
MLIVKCVLVILISFVLKDIKSEELLNTTTNKEQTSSTEASLNTPNDLISLTLDTLATTSNDASNSASLKKDLNSFNLENLITTPITPLESTASVLNDLQDNETTPSWELIYPEQNSSTSSNTPFSTTSTTETSPANLPKYFKVDDVTNCQKYFGTCLKQVLSSVLPKLKDGSKALHIPSLDPIYFNSTAFQYNSGPFTGFITIRYAHIYGFTSMQFKKVDFNKQGNKFKARFSMLIPKMFAIGSYKGDMHVNNVRVRPRGEFNVTMSGLGVDMLALGAVIQKNDHTFLRLTKSNATTTLKESKINATGIFPDQRLNDIVVNVANQYWRDLFNIVLPETRNNWLPIVTDALNGALAMVPFDFLK